MDIIRKINKAWNVTKFFVVKNAPTILTVGGTISTVAGTIFAAKSSLKLRDLMEERQAEKDAIESAHENNLEGYSEEDYKKDLIKCKTTTAKQIVKLYWPAAACTAVGVAGILSGHGMMQSRNAALGAAVVAGERAFSAYRDRVRGAIGEEEESKLSFPVDKWVDKREVTDEETGEVSVVEEKRRGLNDIPRNIYSVWWDESSYFCKNDPLTNRAFLFDRQNHWNDILRRREGFPVFLNEIARDLDLECTQVGQIAGWVYGDKIDFGITDPVNKEFLEGQEEACFLNFNCRGNVLGHLQERPFGGYPYKICDNEDAKIERGE